MTFAEAIAQQENVNPSYNNPCALTAAPSTFCQSGKTGILVNFCSLDDGWNACNKQIERNSNRGLNISEFFGGKPGVYPGYSNAASGNDPVTYTNNVSTWTGLDASTVLSDLTPGQLYYNPVNSNIATVDTGSGASENDWTNNFSLASINPMYIGLGLLGLIMASKLMN